MDKNRLKELQKLKMNKYRDKHFLVETEHLVEEALKYTKVIEIFSTYPKDNQTLITESEMKKLTSTVSNVKTIALVEKKQAITKSQLVLALADVQDPGNVGSLIRSAIGFGFKQVLLSPGCADLYNSKTIRASQGAIFQAGTKVSDLKKEIADYKNQGYRIIGTALKDGRPLKSYEQNNEKIFLLLGNEGSGLPEDIIALCDDLLFIEMTGIESLNVLAAGSILMYQLKGSSMG
ncbi:MAG: RNA methyltransferase [Erysipelotrichales bacterium]|nr:RNA methyltransferase [Erysipelotrichales bacterium]